MPANLRFLLSLENTKMVVLQKQGDLHIYATPHPTKKNKQTARLEAEHVTEALAAR